MKYIFIIFITITLLCNTQGAFAITYKNTIPEYENPKQANTISNINRAQLLCTHIENFQKNILQIGKKYAIQKDETITQAILITNKMREACSEIQTQELEKSVANEIITSIVVDLDKLNSVIKKHLKLRISEIDNYKKKYSKAAQKISLQLDRLNKALENKIYSKKSRTNRDKKILSRVAKMKNISKKLNNFGNLEIYKKSEIRSALIRLIQDLRAEIQNIKNL